MLKSRASVDLDDPQPGNEWLGVADTVERIFAAAIYVVATPWRWLRGRREQIELLDGVVEPVGRRGPQKQPLLRPFMSLQESGFSFTTIFDFVEMLFGRALDALATILTPWRWFR